MNSIKLAVFSIRCLLDAVFYYWSATSVYRSRENDGLKIKFTLARLLRKASVFEKKNSSQRFIICIAKLSLLKWSISWSDSSQARHRWQTGTWKLMYNLQTAYIKYHNMWNGLVSFFFFWYSKSLALVWHVTVCRLAHKRVLWNAKLCLLPSKLSGKPWSRVM